MSYEIMICFLFVTAYCVLSFCTVPVAGQCTVSSCADSGSEESLEVSLEEHDHRLETMNQNMCSAFEKLEAAVNRTNARDQEELCQDLKKLYYNMSVKIDRTGEKIPIRLPCPTTEERETYLNSMNSSLTAMIVRLDSLSEKIPERLEYRTNQEQEEYLRVLNLSLTSMTIQVRNEEHIHAVNENLSSVLQTVNRSLDEKLLVMQVQLQDQSSTLQNVNSSLDGKFQVIQVQLQDQLSALQTVNRSLDEKFQVMQSQSQSQSSVLQTVNRSLDEKLQVMQVQLSSLINESVAAVLRELQEKFQTLNDSLSSAIVKSNEKLNASLDRLKQSNQSVEVQDHFQSTSFVCDCSDVKANGYTTSGVYRIYVVDQGQRYYANVFCDMTTTNGSWTVFQRRKDGNVGFYREWNEYANGFGNSSGEFWLGNNFLHLLTSKRRYRLRIDLEDFEGEKRYAEYSTIDISSSADRYRLSIGTYSGTAGDSLSYHNGYRFSTKDSDNDADSGNCAFRDRGAWWYKDCQTSNLNGVYLRGRYSSIGLFNGYEGIRWHAWYSQWYSLKTTEMKISSSY